MSEIYWAIDDYKIVLEAVKKNGWNLEYASKRLQDNYEIVLEAVKNYGYALQYASDNLLSNKSFILKLLMLFKYDKEKLFYIKKFIDKDLKKELKI